MIESDIRLKTETKFIYEFKSNFFEFVLNLPSGHRHVGILKIFSATLMLSKAILSRQLP